MPSALQVWGDGCNSREEWCAQERWFLLTHKVCLSSYRVQEHLKISGGIIQRGFLSHNSERVYVRSSQETMEGKSSTTCLYYAYQCFFHMYYLHITSFIMIQPCIYTHFHHFYFNQPLVPLPSLITPSSLRIASPSTFNSCGHPQGLQLTFPPSLYGGLLFNLRG